MFQYEKVTFCAAPIYRSIPSPDLACHKNMHIHEWILDTALKYVRWDLLLNYDGQVKQKSFMRNTPECSQWFPVIHSVHLLNSKCRPSSRGFISQNAINLMGLKLTNYVVIWNMPWAGKDLFNPWHFFCFIPEFSVSPNRKGLFTIEQYTDISAYCRWTF